MDILPGCATGTRQDFHLPRPRLPISTPDAQTSERSAMFRHILLCTHGTPGARQAEALVFAKLLPAFPEARVTVLTVFNQDWALMTGDDWLNTSATRNTFRSHVENQLSQETAAHWDTIRKRYPAASRHHFMHIFGPVEATIAEVARDQDCDLVVMGAWQKKRAPGFKHRITPEGLHPLLSVPLMIAP
jgi:nucleotide-binding universal stress UspA family protein